MDTYGAPLYTHGHMRTAHHPFPHLSIRPFHRSSSVLVHPLSSTSFSLLTWTITFYEPITTTSNNNNNNQPPLYTAISYARSRAHRARLPPCSVRVSSTCPASDPAPIGNASGAPTDRGSVHSVTPGVNEHSLIGRLIPRCCVRGVPSKQYQSKGRRALRATPTRPAMYPTRIGNASGVPTNRLGS